MSTPTKPPGMPATPKWKPMMSRRPTRPEPVEGDHPLLAGGRTGGVGVGGGVGKVDHGRRPAGSGRSRLRRCSPDTAAAPPRRPGPSDATTYRLTAARTGPRSRALAGGARMQAADGLDRRPPARRPARPRTSPAGRPVGLGRGRGVVDPGPHPGTGPVLGDLAGGRRHQDHDRPDRRTPARTRAGALGSGRTTPVTPQPSRRPAHRGDLTGHDVLGPAGERDVRTGSGRPASSAPARLSSELGPPPPTMAYGIRSTACQVMLLWRKANGNTRRTWPGGRSGATVAEPLRQLDRHRGQRQAVGEVGDDRAPARRRPPPGRRTSRVAVRPAGRGRPAGDGPARRGRRRARAWPRAHR